MATWFEHLKELASQSTIPPTKEAEPASEPPKGEAVAPKAEAKPELEGLWDVAAQTPEAVTISKALTPEKMRALAEGQNFSGMVPEEMRQGIPSEALDQLGRAVYTAAVQHTGALADGLVEARVKDVEANVAKQVKEQLALQETRRDLKVPKEAEPLMTLVSSAIAAKFPNADAGWVAEQSRNLFIETAKAIDPKPYQENKAPVAETTQSATPEVDNWMAWATSDSKSSNKSA